MPYGLPASPPRSTIAGMSLVDPWAAGVRLQRAVRMAATSKDWVRIAAEAGYYDQAHLIADFRQLVGLTPGAFLKRAIGARGR